eukprot:scaffold3727_cov97-Isochrysis_galbana.AAC.1
MPVGLTDSRLTHEYFARWGDVVHVGLSLNYRDVIVSAQERKQLRQKLYNSQGRQRQCRGEEAAAAEAEYFSGGGQPCGIGWGIRAPRSVHSGDRLHLCRYLWWVWGWERLLRYPKLDEPRAITRHLARPME